MATVIGISGALRRASYNSALLRAVRDAAPDGLAIEIASIREIPLYDGDLEREQGVPPAVRALQDRIAAADGLLIATPEHNHSVPGVLKNAIDWLSRPPKEIARVFRGKPVALIGATPGRGATALAQAAWLPILRALDVQPFFGPRLAVPEAATAFDAEGRVIDAALSERIASYAAALAEFVARGSRPA